jgi:hypothetical protein
MESTFQLLDCLLERVEDLGDENHYLPVGVAEVEIELLLGLDVGVSQKLVETREKSELETHDPLILFDFPPPTRLPSDVEADRLRAIFLS